VDEVAEDIDVAIGQGIGGKNVVVGDDDDFLTVQTLAFWPNSRLKTPMVPGPQTSWS